MGSLWGRQSRCAAESKAGRAVLASREGSATVPKQQQSSSVRVASWQMCGNEEGQDEGQKAKAGAGPRGSPGDLEGWSRAELEPQSQSRGSAGEGVRPGTGEAALQLVQDQGKCLSFPELLLQQPHVR